MGRPEDGYIAELCRHALAWLETSRVEPMAGGITAEQFAAMLAEYKAAEAAFAGDETARTRYYSAYRALYAAHPVEPAVMAAQLRWYMSDFDGPESRFPRRPDDLALLAPMVASLRTWHRHQDLCRRIDAMDDEAAERPLVAGAAAAAAATHSVRAPQRGGRCHCGRAGVRFR